MTDYKELYESATNEVATLKDEAKALDRKLTNLVLDLNWDCQRMSQSGLATYNAICRALNIEEYKEEYEEIDKQMKGTSEWII
jgi:hypothetical protein